MILVTSTMLLAILKASEVSSLGLFYKSERAIKLKTFAEAKTGLDNENIELLELWESILTGRAAPVSKIIKDRYQMLGLSHVFTPSGFHLSAVLNPVMKLVRNSKAQLVLLVLLTFGIYSLPGMTALKRMITIKGSQKILGTHLGFGIALLLDTFFGTFHQNTLSFTYSFLFLGIIYSGLSGLPLIVWFFLAQALLAYFQETEFSLLILLFSPVLNLVFTIIMPLLFFLCFPLWKWQLNFGLFLLKTFQGLVDWFASLSSKVPTLEIHVFSILLLVLLLTSRKRLFIAGVFFFCHSLNLDYFRMPGLPSNEFVPREGKSETLLRGEKITVKFQDGSCRLKLVRGVWIEHCSPRRGSKRKN